MSKIYRLQLPRNQIQHHLGCSAVDPLHARVGVEAGVRQGWDQWLLGERGNAKKAGFVGMTGFGASAPAASAVAGSTCSVCSFATVDRSSDNAAN